MKWTKSMIQTLRDNPQDAEIDSHKLLVRAGIVKKLAGGLYTYLPLGMRSLKKVQAIIREEMDRAGALEIVMPILQPAELWKQSGRWESMGPGMFRVKDHCASASSAWLRERTKRGSSACCWQRWISAVTSCAMAMSMM